MLDKPKYVCYNNQARLRGRPFKSAENTDEKRIEKTFAKGIDKALTFVYNKRVADFREGSNARRNTVFEN